MGIHQESIDEIQHRLQIEEVIGEYVVLKKKGNNLWGLCPFHHEKTPSFSVVPKLGFYKCFGCDAKGDAITFLRQHHSISYIEAIHLLAEKYGILLKTTTHIPTQSPQVQEEEEKLYDLLGNIARYFSRKLQKADKTSLPKSYLAKRDISEALMERFALGYSPNEWQAVSTYALAQGYDQELLFKAGLIKHKENTTYDFFRHRIMFPIHNLAGAVVGFGGRCLEQQEHIPKYLNSPETAIYKKSHILYGLYQAKSMIRKEDSCYLVEGYTDLLALHSAGIANVVASSGTSLTSSQVRLLGRFTKHINLLFDSDTAGQEATLRSIDLLVAQDFSINIISLPQGEDPASYMEKKGKDSLITYLKHQAEDFISFKVNTILKDTPKKEINARHAILQKIIATLAIIPNIVKRTLYSQRCSDLLNIPLATLEQAISHVKDESVPRSQRTKAQKPQTWDVPREKTLLYILLCYGNHTLEIGKLCSEYILEQTREEWLTSNQYKKIFQAYKKAWTQEGEALTTDLFIQDQPEDIKQMAMDIMIKKYQLGAWEKYYQVTLPEEHENLQEWCTKTLQRLEFPYLQKLLTIQRKAIGLASDEKEIEDLIIQYQALQKQIQNLASHLGIVATLPTS